MRLSATAAATAWMLAASAFAQQMHNPIRSGGWSGGDYYRDGLFQHCAVAARYTRGDALVFVVDRSGAFWIALTNDQWALTSGQHYPVEISVDGFPALRRSARAISTRQVLIAVDDRQAFFDLVRKGYRLSVRTQRMDMGYDLTGTYAALTEVVACTARFTAQDRRPIDGNPFAAAPPPAGGNPFGSESRPQTSDPFSAAAPAPGTNPFPGQSASPPSTPPTLPAISRERSADMALRVLAGAELRGFQSAEIPALRRQGYAATWTLPGGLLGGLIAWENTPADSVARSGAAAIARDARGCSGQFASGQQETEIDGGWSGRRVFTLCRKPSSGSEWSANYSVARFVSGLSVVVVTVQPRVGAAAAADPAEVDARVFRSAAFRRLVQAPP